MEDKIQELTKEGYKKLEEQLEYLKTHQRREVADRIRQAKEFGEIGENSEYEDAKAEQAFIEGEIMRLESILRHATIVEHAGPVNIVSIGSIVTVKDMDSGAELEFKIVGSNETDPPEGKISNQSPVGKALTGGKKNQIIEVSVPKGTIKYKILKISKSRN